MEPFTADEIDALAARVEDQLASLRRGPGAAVARAAEGPPPTPAASPIANVAAAVGDSEATVLARLKAALRKDACQPGGILHEQWKTWRDLAAKDTVKSVAPVLVAMGLAGSPLATATVALSAYLIHIGLTAWCEGEG